MYKIRHGLAPPVLNQFVNVAPNGYRLTRSAVRGDCIVPLRKSVFSQRLFSVRAAREWNSIPTNCHESDLCGSLRWPPEGTLS